MKFETTQIGVGLTLSEVQTEKVFSEAETCILSQSLEGRRRERMRSADDLVHFAGRGLRKAGRVLTDWHSLRGTWFDVGAFRCEHTYEYALFNPSLRVFAFEPNMHLAAKLFGVLPNIIVVPMAVSETDGCAEFNITAFPASS